MKLSYVWPVKDGREGGVRTPGSDVVDPSFSTVAELRRALTFNEDATKFFGGPYVGMPEGRDFDVYPAWGWLKFLIRTRSDWWPALGIALQHAVREDGEIAQRALADFIEKYPLDAQAILEWITPLAKEWPDTPLAARIADQAVRWDKEEETGIVLPVFDQDEDPSRRASQIAVRSLADVAPVMALTAKHGWVGGYELGYDRRGPWTWLVFGSLSHRWLGAAIPAACASFANGTEREVSALLEWFKDRFDLWRYRDLFAAWKAAKPSWWDQSADAAAAIADEQAATPPILDLEPLYGKMRPRPSIVT